MANILHLFDGTTFGPDVTLIMGEAYDHAARNLHDKGQPALVQEVIAKRIIQLAGSGERDPQRLATLALHSLGIELEAGSRLRAHEWRGRTATGYAIVSDRTCTTQKIDAKCQSATSLDHLVGADQDRR